MATPAPTRTPPARPTAPLASGAGAPGAAVATPQPAAPLDGSAELLRRTLPLMSRHAAGYAPDSYALWYEYVRGGNPALRAELDRLVNACERLSHELTFELHQKHVRTTPRSRCARRAPGCSS